MGRRKSDPGYDRKSTPTVYNGVLYASYSEAALAKCLTCENLDFQYSPKYTWKTKRRKEVVYYPDFVFPRSIYPFGLIHPLDYIEMKGVIHGGGCYKIRSMNAYHGMVGTFVTLEMVQYWQHYGMFKCTPSPIKARDTSAKENLTFLLKRKLSNKGIRFTSELVLSYHSHADIIDIAFHTGGTHLPGVYHPIHYLVVVDSWLDITPTLVWIQDILDRREKKTLFFATRSYLDFWLYHW